MMDAEEAQQPLIRDEGDFESSALHGDEEDGRGSEEEGVDESTLTTPSLFIWMLTFAAGVSGLLFGYDTGVISSTLVSINTDLSARPLSTVDKSLITSCTSLFALIASPVTGVLADSWGRKRVILVADVLFVVGALWQAWTGSIWGMIGGRSVVGLAVGSASFVVPLYISELSPSPFRGRLVTVASLFITGGQVVAYVVGWLFSTRLHGWRWMVGLGALPAVVQFLTLNFMPETPRWLVKAGFKDRARKVLLKVYGKGTGMESLVDNLLRKVEMEVLEEEEAVVGRSNPEAGPKTGWKTKLAGVTEGLEDLLATGSSRRALVIACMLQGFQQLCGFNSLMYFSATIFQLVGFTSPTLTSLSIATTNFAFTLVAFHAIDRIGRRRILLLSVPVMTLGLALSALAFVFLDLPPHPSDTTTPSPSQPSSGGPSPWALLILLAMITYVASYAVGLGTVPWQQSELFPLAHRALGSGLATATNWSANCVVGLTFLPLMERLTPTGTFALYAGVCVACWGAVWRVYPETAGLGLEEVGGLLREGWGVGESVRAFEGRKRRGRGGRVG